MAVKTNQALKKQRKLEKKAKVEKITNWFMINLAWGVFGFILLRYMSNPLITDYDMSLRDTLGVLGIIAAVIGVALIALRVVLNYKQIKFFKKKRRVLNYGIFTLVIAAVLIYLQNYVDVRNVVCEMIPSMRRFSTYFWITDGLSYAIGIYLLGAFIYTAVRVAIIEKKK